MELYTPFDGYRTKFPTGPVAVTLVPLPCYVRLSVDVTFWSKIPRVTTVRDRPIVEKSNLSVVYEQLKVIRRTQKVEFVP